MTAKTAASILFWLMIFVGGTTVAPCLILPAWFEYYAEAQKKTQHEAHNAYLGEILSDLEKEAKYMRHDPDYLARVARNEAGLDGPEGLTILIEAAERRSADEFSPPPIPANKRDEIHAMVCRVQERLPFSAAFTDPHQRPYVMACGGGLILLAILLLGFDNDSQETAEPTNLDDPQKTPTHLPS